MSELPVVRQDESGAMTAECLDELRGAMLEAAAEEDFRTAAQYKTMVDVLGPREPRPLSDFASEDPDEAADLFLQNGVRLPSAAPDASAPSQPQVLTSHSRVF